MGVLESALESSKILEKAVIEITDLRNVETAERQPPVQASSNADRGERNREQAQQSSQVKKKNARRAQAELKRKMAMATALDAASPDSDGVYTGVTDAIEGAVARRFTVQFNPSTLTVSGYAGGSAAINDYSSSGRSGLSYKELKPHIDFSVQLIFDDVVRSEAFLNDAMSFNATNAINAGSGRLTRRKFSVQEEVEAFLAIVRNKYTKGLTFAWGKLMYSGVVTNCNAKYVMFAPSGKPIRATVQLRMICVDESIAQRQTGFWRDRYKEAFENVDTSFNTLANKTSNLINLNH